MDGILYISVARTSLKVFIHCVLRPKTILVWIHRILKNYLTAVRKMVSQRPKCSKWLVLAR